MKCGKKELQLYAITDRHWLNGRSLYEVVKESLDGGVTFLQLREKQLDKDHFLEEAKKLQGTLSGRSKRNAKALQRISGTIYYQ